MQPDFRHVLVLEIQAIGLEGQSCCGARAFVRFNALASPSRVSGDGKDAQRRIGRLLK